MPAKIQHKPCVESLLWRIQIDRRDGLGYIGTGTGRFLVCRTAISCFIIMTLETMERNWTKRKLFALAQGDGETVRLWQSQVGRYIYTGLYYQLNKDESQAATLTARILSQALRELSAFDPEQTTMYLWLKDSAARQFQTALVQQGLKSQRPWAWSEVPPKILDTLKRLRNETLSPEVSACGAVVEMVQAALADLSEQDRDLLLRRYTRLDTVEHIASEHNLSAEKVNQQLFLARHAFRRGLFFLVQSANPDFTEPAVSGGIELFESNLETLLRSVNASAPMSSESAETIKRAVQQTASEIAANPPTAAAAPNHRAIRRVTIAACLLTAAVVVWLSVRREPPALPPEQTTPPQTTDVTPQSQDLTNEAKLKRVLDIGVQGDVAGLLEILRTGDFIEQVTAAHYLGQIGDASAVEPLLDAEGRWYKQSQDNPFLRAAEEILERLEAAKTVQDTSVADSPQPVEPPQVQAESASTPLLTGQITDAGGDALPGVQVTLYRDDPSQASAIEGFSTTTDAQGRYTFETLPEGRFIVTVRDPRQRIAETRRLMWATDGAASVLDFGGAAAVAGHIIIDGNPLAGQTLLLSDKFNTPEQGVFTAEIKTDADGGFVFNGVPPGLYGLFSRYIANRWTLLGYVEVDSADVALTLDLPTATLIVQAGELPETLDIVTASLRYGADSSDTLAEWKAVRSEVETVFMINGVIPGGYTLCVDFSNGVRILQNVVVDDTAEQELFIDSIPFGTAGIQGRFLSVWPEGLTLDCAEPPMRISVMTEQDGYFAMNDLPSGVYSLGVILKGVFVPYLELGLFENQPAAFDPDPVQLARSRSPLYVYVTDPNGRGLAGGQVWLAGDGGFYPAESFGRGYFVAAPAGQYTLYAAFAGYPAAEKAVTLPASDVRAPQTETNSYLFRLIP